MLRVFSVFISAVFISACAGQPPKEIAQENLLLESGDSQNIIQFYKKNLSKSPEYRAKLVSEYLDLGDLKSARLYANTYSEDDLEKPRFILTLARISLLDKSFNTAEAQLEQYREYGGDELKYHLLMAKINAHQKHYSEAEKHFLEAKKLGAEDSKISNDLAVLKMMQNRYSEAVEILYPAYVQHPVDARIRANLLLSAAKSGQDEIAMDILSQDSTPDEAIKKFRALQLSLQKDAVENPVHAETDLRNISKPVAVATTPALKDKKSVGKKPVGNKADKKPAGADKNPMIIGRKPTTDKKPANVRPVKVTSNYRIQILATYKGLKKDYKNYLKSRFSKVYKYNFGSLVRYCVGDFETPVQARAYLKSSGLKDGFVVNYGNKEFTTL